MECKICGIQWKKRGNISFHSIPKNPILRKKWVQVCNLERSVNRKMSSIRICSAHFDADSFSFIPSKDNFYRSSLKPDAVPKLGIFNREKFNRRKLLQNRQTAETNCIYLEKVFEEHYIKHIDDMNKKMTIENDKPRTDGFRKGFEADKILGSTDDNGELMYLMQWKGTDTIDIVRAKEANVKCPQIVIQFYEDRLAWRKTKLCVN